MWEHHVPRGWPRLADDAVEVSSFGSAPDLSAYSHAVVEVLDAGLGTLVVTPRSNGGVARTLTVAAGQVLRVDVRAIGSTADGTTVSRVRIYGWLA